MHIGKGGNIDKGPKELVGKTENGAHAAHHSAQSEAHNQAAQAKGGDHVDTKHHLKAGTAHAMAAHHFGNSDKYAAEGNLNAAKNTRRVAEREAATAKEHESKLGAQQADDKKKKFEKPDAHKALHSDAGDDVKGSEKHEAEHKRLMGQYDKANADWQRHAINNQVSKNAEEATKTKATLSHYAAEQASLQARKTEQPEHHAAAHEAINQAIAAHERAGGEGSRTKVEELLKMRKPHAAAMAKAKKEAEKAAPKESAAKGGKPAPPASAPLSDTQHDAMAEHHNRMAKEHYARNDGAGGYKHTEAEELHRKAKFYATEATRYSKTTPELQKKHAEASAAAQEASRKLAPPPAKPAPAAKTPAGKSSSGHNVFRSNRHGGSALEKIAERVTKKAAEEVADQDPKHKK